MREGRKRRRAAVSFPRYHRPRGHACGVPSDDAGGRKREGLRVCRATWLIGVSAREYREIEAGDRMPSLRTYERIAELYGWPERFEGRVKSGSRERVWVTDAES